jgi:ADP-heptose:LPS heptosyltransferase
MRAARILVLRGGAIGDFIVTVPALQALRDRWPDGHIEIIGYPHVARLAEAAGLVNKVRSLDEASVARYFVEDAIVREDDREYFSSFDIVVNYLHDPGGFLNDNLKRFGVKILIAASPMVAGRHAVDHFIEPLQALAIYEDIAIPMLRFPNVAPKEPWVAIHPGSGGKQKCWPIQNFIELAGQIRRETEFEPVIITGEAEREYIKSLDDHVQTFRRIHNLSLVELAGQLTGASCYIGNDGGVTHLAAALGVPTIALFGPSNPDLWSPRGKFVRVIASKSNTMESICPQDVWREFGNMTQKEPT